MEGRKQRRKERGRQGKKEEGGEESGKEKHWFSLEGCLVFEASYFKSHLEHCGGFDYNCCYVALMFSRAPHM